MARTDIIDRIEAILNAVTSPAAQAVYVGEPLAIPQADRVFAFWLTGDTEVSKTLTDTQIDDEFDIRVYMRPQMAPELRKAAELDLWNAVRQIKTDLRADSELSGQVDDLNIGNAVYGWSNIGEGDDAVTFRVATIPLMVRTMESETITP